MAVAVSVFPAQVKPTPANSGLQEGGCQSSQGHLSLVECLKGVKSRSASSSRAFSGDASPMLRTESRRLQSFPDALVDRRCPASRVRGQFHFPTQGRILQFCSGRYREEVRPCSAIGNGYTAHRGYGAAHLPACRACFEWDAAVADCSCVVRPT